MTQHPTAFTIEKAIPAAEAVPDLVPPRELRAPTPEPKSPPTGDVASSPRKRSVRKLLLIGASLVAVAGAADFGWRYWSVGRFHVSTDDAYVKADSTTIAPKVPGYIASVLVGDNEAVTAGQTLARIDDRDYRVALEQAEADVAAAKANIGSKQAAIAAQQSAIEAAKATIAVDEANETFAEQEDKRYAELAAKGYGSLQNAQQAAARIAAARASVVRANAALASATRQLDVLQAELGQAQAALGRAEAVQDQAQLNLSYTAIVTPIDGVIGNRTLRVGQYVQAGTQLMAVVPTQAAYIVANYKETQLTDVRAGQPVNVEVDTFPGRVFRGRVDSLSPASGQEFALLPPDNATGNFTKVVQRIPVKIVLDTGAPLAVVLRPGMSVYPTIDTKAEATRIASVPDRNS
ncbi:HlyD family secretion protein [Microvirga zambiensis]|uniref:HlyD family secretion protein n=1 Tax=Microvirga zambiensis TaxID=1402137 RepID=UPI00191F4D8F|nr:HlyD family secretion protein [Microvirga zambiensis]